MNNNRRQMKSFRGIGARKAIAKKVRKEVKKDVKKVLKTKRVYRPRKQGLFRELGAGVGSLFGMRNVGAAAGQAVGRIFGSGDYLTNTGNLAENGPPTFAPLNACCRIQHREYLTDVVSTVGFGSTTYYINPGLFTTFPWLSQIAANFEEYQLKGMVVYLKTNSATAVSSTNTALGVWGVVTQYDATDADFTNKQQAENYQGTTTAVPSQSVLHAVECKPRANVLQQLYIRDGGLSINEDQKFYDLGKFQVFTQGAQAASTIGELWISYDVELYKPRLPEGGVNVFTDSYYGSDANGANYNSATPLGTFVGTRPTLGNIGTIIDGSNQRIVFPPTAPDGIYLVVVNWTGNGVTLSSAMPTTTYTGSVINFTYFNSGASSIRQMPQPNSTGIATNQSGMVVCVKKSGSNAGYVSLGAGGSLPVSPVGVNVVVTLLDPSSSVNLTSQIAKQQRFTPKEAELIREMLEKYKKQALPICIEEPSELASDDEIIDIPQLPEIVRSETNKSNLVDWNHDKHHPHYGRVQRPLCK